MDGATPFLSERHKSCEPRPIAGEADGSHPGEHRRATTQDALGARAAPNLHLKVESLMRQLTISITVPIALALALAGCSSNGNAPSSADASIEDGSGGMQDSSMVGTSDTSPPADTGTGSSDAGVGSPDSGGGSDAGAASLGTLSFVAQFSESSYQLPEGLWATNAGSGTPIVSWAPLATLVTGPSGGGELRHCWEPPPVRSRLESRATRPEISMLV